ncbi:MAG: Histidine triad (HIT) protein [Parcubacteria group bacterium GW2011_GWF2_38_76]|nr:MAG: Histidine triad (HIT) protein [Parcubacteria group bacterium GW2011_GWF2_38_76]HBM46213.1 HIT family protein [Patescibacteria group bacterium]
METTNNDCVFCKIVAGEIPAEKIYEDEDLFAFLDITPINAGHTLIIPKKHYENLFELPDDILKKISIKLRDLGASVKEAMNAEGLNIGMNNRPAAGQIVPHAHFHLIPRYIKDGYKHWGGRKYDEGEITKVAKEIRERIK